MTAPTHDDPLCLACNYPLRGLESRRCPECGREFDPRDPYTMNPGRPLDSLDRTFLGPTGRWASWVMWTLAALGALGPAWLLPSNLTAILWLLLWAVFTFACWYRASLRRAVVKSRRQFPSLLRVDDPFRRKTRITFSVVTLVIVTRAPFWVTLQLSRPWLDREAYYVLAVLPASVDPPRNPRFRGLVRVEDVHATPTRVTFYLFGGGRVQYTMPGGDGRPRMEWETWSGDWFW